MQSTVTREPRVSALPAQREGITPDLYTRFIRYLDASPKSVETYERALRQLFAYFSAQGVTHPIRENILQYRAFLRQKGLCPTTVQNYLTAARLFFRWTAQEGLYPNVAERVKGAVVSKEHKKDYLTSSQVKDLLASILRDSEGGLRDYAILLVMITGGLRAIEVTRANVGDLRVAGDHIVLYLQGKGQEEKTEYVKMEPPVEAALRAYLKCRGCQEQSAPLFASLSRNNLGGRLSTRAVSGMVKARLRDAGFLSDRLTAHSLRHTAVTLSLLAGRTLPEVQQFARHQSIMTTQIYNHSLDKSRNACAEAIAKAIF